MIDVLCIGAPIRGSPAMTAEPGREKREMTMRKGRFADMQMNEAELKKNSSLPDGEASGEADIEMVELFYHLVDKLPQILIVAVVCAMLMGLWSVFFVKRTYEATAKLYVINASNSIVNLSDLQIGNYLTNDYQQVFSNYEIHEKVRSRLNLTYEDEQLDKMIKISNPSDTRILVITVISENPNEAVRMVEAYAEEAQLFIEDTMDSKMPTTFEHAHLKGEVPKGTAMKVILGFILGAAVVIGIETVRFIIDDRITTSEFIEKRVGLVTLGMMPVVDRDDSDARASARRRTSSKPASKK